MYYHYTNGSGAKAIRQSGYIQPSEESGSFGPGVYLTDLDPNDFFRDEILQNNYGGIRSNFRNRADWVVAVFEKNFNTQLLRRVHVPGDRRIFVYPTSISVSANQIYDKPTCFRAYTVCEADTFSSDEDHYFDSADDVTGSNEFDTDDVLSDSDEIEYSGGDDVTGSDEFDTDDVLSDSDEIEYSGGDEEIEEIDEHQQTDNETCSDANEEEQNGCSEYDSNEYEGTSAEEECYENSSGAEDSYEDAGGVEEIQCYSEEAEEYGSDGSEEDLYGDEHDASDDCEYDSNNGFDDEQNNVNDEQDGFDDEQSDCYYESDDDCY